MAAEGDVRPQFHEKLNQLLETLSENFTQCEALAHASLTVNAMQVALPESAERAITTWQRVSAPVVQHCLDENIDAVVQANIPELAPFGVAEKYATFGPDERKVFWEYIQSLNQLAALHCTTVPPILQKIGEHANKFIAEIGVQPDANGNVPGFNVNDIFTKVCESLSEEKLSEMVTGLSEEGGGDFMGQIAPLLGMFAGAGGAAAEDEDEE